jgi:glycosyltransferase involved in cell wall biosynthesis
MVGPVAKIDPSSLPRRPNIHYLGRQPYEELPTLLKGFAVCLMPFALNKATRSISPTKALEYMAAQKPIVSTPVPDVAAAWDDVVYIAGTAAAFAQAITAALAEDGKARRQRHRREQAHIRRHTWDAIVGEMQQLIAAALANVKS